MLKRIFKVVELLNHFIARRLWGPRPHRVLLRALGWRSSTVVQLQRAGENYTCLEVGDSGVSVKYADWPPSEEPYYQNLTAEIGLWRIRNSVVVLNTKYSAVMTGNQLAIHPRIELGPYHFNPSNRVDSTAPAYLHRGGELLIRRKRRFTAIPRAVYCGTRAPLNWGHWLLNFLPGVAIAADFFGGTPAPPLIVPAGYRDLESRATLFDHIWGNREVIICDPDVEFRVDELFWFEQPVADSPLAANPVNLVDKTVNVSALLRFRSRILDLIGKDCHPLERVRNVFLAREAGRRDYNHEEIHQIASAEGYEIIYPNRLSIREQVALMNSARRIVGPTGSAFANILFAGPGAKALVFARPDEVDNWWPPFAFAAGVPMYGLYGVGTESNPWALNPVDIKKNLQFFLD